MNARQPNAEAAAQPQPLHDHAEYGLPSPRPAGGPETDAMLVYVGLAAIGRAVGAGPGTVKRWIREEAFPARRCSDGIYRATAEGMRSWFQPPFPDAYPQPPRGRRPN
ncbi:hypothetical protein [Desulfovibrio psychrotolerans]|uniref:Uncharacterized protein n=1 Tax=Desulfovibrio psychrotolerans TaxID=415242 RepID=A0A7J0BSH4_9BACT|nr:hypothetical protein [Desulfovibrio psychrotolerans]GFM36630.1 hypothetical protein DSM19430T_13140 [Desulfovibrio psychrotolerans]